jgi:mono/diheme cytochrome c family protein
MAAVFSAAVTVLAVVSGCGGNPTSSTATPTTTAPAGASFGQYADSGKTVFASHCSKCHGDQGQGITGPALIGSNANLTKYNTAQGLLNFVATSMPLDAPGSLTHQEYLQVLCFLLVQNNFASADGSFNESALGSVQLK